MDSQSVEIRRRRISMYLGLSISWQDLYRKPFIWNFLLGKIIIVITE